MHTSACRQTSSLGATCSGHACMPARARRSLPFDPLQCSGRPHRRCIAKASADASDDLSKSSMRPMSAVDDFCIIESRDAVGDFASLQLEEIRSNIAARRNRIFLLMEEVRRLRIQARLKGGDIPADSDVEEKEQYLSALPFLPPLTDKTLNTYFTVYAGFFLGVIVFGALLAPLLEVRMGLGGTSYADFVSSLHLPEQLAEVDPIVASFCGGAVGVVSALLVVEVSNVKKQQQVKCLYCAGTGYLPCGNCVGSGVDPASREGCSCCSSTGKVMCTSCLCTGKQLATEHDMRIDPFQ